METHANPVEITKYDNDLLVRLIAKEIIFTNHSFRQISRKFSIPLNIIHLINTGRSNKYRLVGVKYPLRNFSGSVTTIPAKGSRRATDTRVEREAP